MEAFEWQLIYSKTKRQYYIRFWSTANNRVIVWSEYYHNRADAVHAMELVKQYGPHAPMKEYTTL